MSCVALVNDLLSLKNTMNHTMHAEEVDRAAFAKQKCLNTETQISFSSYSEAMHHKKRKKMANRRFQQQPPKNFIEKYQL